MCINGCCPHLQINISFIPGPCTNTAETKQPFKAESRALCDTDFISLAVFVYKVPPTGSSYGRLSRMFLTALFQSDTAELFVVMGIMMCFAI